jgi:hypothetical protein
MRNVTPWLPRQFVPPRVDRGSYLQGVLDAQLGQAEKAYWREHGYRIDRLTGKLIPRAGES